MVSWQAVASGDASYDLVLSASENIDFHQIHAHTVVLPHGLGFNKYVPDSNGPGTRLAGLPPEWVLRAGRATVLLSHPEQRDQLLAASPASAGHTAVVGDTELDRIQASQTLRARYRCELGTGERTLVTLASTWRRDSLLGRWRTLPLQLLGELPADLYQVCLALHPNIWSFYGEHQISLWLSAALDAGLVLIPPESGWQAALIAADQVIADHGSLGLMAAALDKPLLMNPASAETVPESPPDSLVRAAPSLVMDLPLREQLDHARATHRPGQFTSITSRVFAHTGAAAANLRSLVYAKLGLAAQSPGPSLRRIPVPTPTRRPVTSHVVLTVTAEAEELAIIRFPASAWRNEYVADTHVVAGESEADVRLLERAAAITCDRPLTPPESRHWALSMLAANPGARVAVGGFPGDYTAIVRKVGLVRIEMSGSHPDGVSLAASTVYCCWLSGCLRDRVLTVRSGSNLVEASLTVTPAEAGHGEP
ncbi:MAG TPA: hypothetical protein VHX38_14160 [Pseudonocardiaceae bacterium]|nr:hypothetical protein [Pseudonocardiaceae bacterium]